MILLVVTLLAASGLTWAQPVCLFNAPPSTFTNLRTYVYSRQAADPGGSTASDWQRPSVCKPAYGPNTCACGFQCYGYGNPCDDCIQKNQCGQSCCATNGSTAVEWMNSQACNYTALLYRNGTAVCNAFKDNHIDENCT